MNDFENKLRALAFREPPADLRRQVLAAAEPAVGAAPRWTWRDWLWPSPLAWGALASMLIGALILNLAAASPDALDRSAVAVQAESARSTVYSFYAHREDLAWLDRRP